MRRWDPFVVAVWAVLGLGVQLLAVLTAVWNFHLPGAQHPNPDAYRGSVAAYSLVTLVVVVPAVGVVAALRAGQRGNLIAFAVLAGLGVIANIFWYGTRL